ncbi:methyltransferase family protein [Maritimibacter dapengensis]|uniref:methyltransferase family protein n=1 Tax=Maritimibacter dapengensis TaxID=2836868 RepID=UPI0021068014|nr:isoprenylcysteine carboxylmethyltransferase family protein [Maritimibacter dapengensis]
MREEILLLRWLDIPPTWLVAGLLSAFGLDRLLPGLGFGWDWTRLVGDILIVAGLGSMGAAVLEFIRARTSFIPRRRPSAFLRSGIYRFTRNPIYLGDAMVLAGAILHWDVLPALVLVPVFGSFIERRFIRGEEAGLIAAFGDEARDWMGQVRRWL